MPLNQSLKQSDLALCCGPLYQNQRSHTKINQEVKKDLYNWILRHPQVVVSPIANYCLKLSIDGQVEPQFVRKILLHVLVIELHNSMVSPPEEGRLNGTIIQKIILSSVIKPYVKF